MAILPRELELEGSDKLARVRRGYERAIAENQLDDLADHLIADLYAVPGELFERLALRLTTIVDQLREDLEQCGVELGATASPPDLMPIEISAPDPDKKGIDPRDLVVAPLIVVVGVATMSPILIAGGAGAALIRGTQVFDRSRKERARKQLAEISSDLQRQLSLVLHQATVEARSSLTNELDDALESRRSDLAEEIRSLKESGPGRHARASSPRSGRLRDRC